MTRDEAVVVALSWCPACHGAGTRVVSRSGRIAGKGTALYWEPEHDEEIACGQCGPVRKALVADRVSNSGSGE